MASAGVRDVSILVDVLGAYGAGQGKSNGDILPGNKILQ